MSNIWLRLEECLYFCRRYGPALLLVLLPVVLPAFMLKHFRAWWALGEDEKLIQQDMLILGLEMVVSLFSGAATLVYASRIVKGEGVPPAQVRREAMLSMAPLFVVQMLVAFATMGGLIFFIVPGLWIMACLMPAYVYVVADKQPVMQALQNSFYTFKPMAWEVLMTFIVLLLGIAGALIVIGGLMQATEALVPWVRMVVDAVLDTLALLVTQLLPLLLVRFYDLGRERAAQDGVTPR